MEESETIDHYLKGHLEGESLAAFESKIRSDPFFQSKVELRQLLIDSIHSAYGDELKIKLRALDGRMDRNSNQIKLRYMIAASLAFIVLASFGVYLYLNNSQHKIERYDISENGIPNTMGLSGNPRLTDAMNHFKAGEYSEALPLLERMPPSDTVLYFTGLSAYRTGNTDKAIRCFQQIENGSEYFTKANYRLGLAFWKKHEIDQAIPALMKAAQDSSGEYGRHAKAILTREFF